jgi:hypothetical protein
MDLSTLKGLAREPKIINILTPIAVVTVEYEPVKRKRVLQAEAVHMILLLADCRA